MQPFSRQFLTENLPQPHRTAHTEQEEGVRPLAGHKRRSRGRHQELPRQLKGSQRPSQASRLPRLPRLLPYGRQPTHVWLPRLLPWLCWRISPSPGPQPSLRTQDLFSCRPLHVDWFGGARPPHSPRPPHPPQCRSRIPWRPSCSPRASPWVWR